MKSHHCPHLVSFLPKLLAFFLGSLWIQAQEIANPQVANIYRLQRGDKISMEIFQESELNRSASIGKSGTISFKLIGNVHVIGLTVPELEQKLRQLYQKDYLVDPKVNIIITGYASKHFHVSGAMEHPGRYAYPEEGTINLAQAIAMGGGIDPDGNTAAVSLFRHKKAGSTTHNMANEGQVTIYPGDTVVVPRLPSRNVTYTATISGEVARPGNVNLGEAGKLDIITALAMAGGYSRIANQKEGILQRKTAKPGVFRTEEVRLKDIRDGKAPMVFINEGDILIIKESRW